MPSTGILTGLRNGPVWKSWSSTRPSCHLGQGNPQCQYRLGDERLESCPAEKGWGIPVYEKLDIRCQCMLTVLKARTFLCSLSYMKSMTIRSREMILPLYSTLVNPSWHAAFCCGLPSTRQTWICWIKSRGRPWKLSKGWNSSLLKKGWEGWGCSALLLPFNIWSGFIRKVERDFLPRPVVIGQG